MFCCLSKMRKNTKKRNLMKITSASPQINFVLIHSDFHKFSGQNQKFSFSASIEIVVWRRLKFPPLCHLVPTYKSLPTSILESSTSQGLQDQPHWWHPQSAPKDPQFRSWQHFWPPSFPYPCPPTPYSSLRPPRLWPWLRQFPAPWHECICLPRLSPTINDKTYEDKSIRGAKTDERGWCVERQDIDEESHGGWVSRVRIILQRNILALAPKVSPMTIDLVAPRALTALGAFALAMRVVARRAAESMVR